jgi:hypothetical protein
MKLAYILFAFALLLPLAFSAPAACEELEAGNASFDMGDGYTASFMFPDIGKPCTVQDAYDENISENPLFKPYGFTISSEDSYLVLVEMYVYPSPQPQYIPQAGTEDSLVPDQVGPRITKHKTISDAPGYVSYDLQVDATGTDTSNAMAAFFRCFPGATDSDGMKGMIEISGQTGENPASAQSLQVFNSLVDSIQITGPGI